MGGGTESRDMAVSDRHDNGWVEDVRGLVVRVQNTRATSDAVSDARVDDIWRVVVVVHSRRATRIYLPLMIISVRPKKETSSVMAPVRSPVGTQSSVLVLVLILVYENIPNLTLMRGYSYV